MINREAGVFHTSYESDMALYALPLAKITAWGMVALLVLLPLPLSLLQNEHLMSIVNTIALAAIGAIGLNILVGYTGQISIGQGAFMMVGGYTAAILSTRYGMPFWVGILAGGAMSALVGVLFGIPSLRIKGLYLAIATLAAQLIMEWTINHVTWISGGAQSSIYVQNPTVFGWELDNEFRRYYLILVFFLLAYFAAQNLVRSRVGRAFIAIRDRDIAAEIIGVNIFKYKLLAFAVSSFYAGVAGALWTYYLRIANYENFTLVVSIEYLAMIIIGGLGSVLGAVLGAIFIKLFPIALDLTVIGISEGIFGVRYGAVADFLANFQLFVFGALIIVFLIAEPEGLARMWENVKRYFRLWPFSY
ncbi:MAG: branched-chain amino acid ABC transporter permease [Candidatus Tectimicrobiota bacterium]|nr:MAG: branched-chain amino acid ABC transporter permease [Candidatus Tectomicrobia bacterium]